METDLEHLVFSDAEVDKAVPEVNKKSTKVKKATLGPKKRYIAFIGNLPYTATRSDLEKLFNALGKVLWCKI